MIRAFFLLLFSVLLLGAGAFAWFIQTLPTSRPGDVRTEAIIVLTGGNGRVEQGLIALARGDAPVLFISGAGHRVTRAEMIAAHAPPAIRTEIAERNPEIVLDYVASTTRSNADQAAEFVAERGIRSIRLITAYYHMPRSLLEFRNKIPGITIVADPVFPSHYRRHGWWQDSTTRRLVFSEFWKYFAALFLRTRFA